MEEVVCRLGMAFMQDHVLLYVNSYKSLITYSALATFLNVIRGCLQTAALFTELLASRQHDLFA